MNKLILVADDDPATRLLLKSNLERQGYLVTTVEDGAQAVLKIKEITPDMVILDVQMPGLYGPALFQTLQNDPATAALPVLFVSSHAAGGDVVSKHVPVGPKVRFMAKPFDLGKLDVVIQELLA